MACAVLDALVDALGLKALLLTQDRCLNEVPRATLGAPSSQLVGVLLLRKDSAAPKSTAHFLAVLADQHCLAAVAAAAATPLLHAMNTASLRQRLRSATDSEASQWRQMAQPAGGACATALETLAEVSAYDARALALCVRGGSKRPRGSDSSDSERASTPEVIQDHMRQLIQDLASHVPRASSSKITPEVIQLIRERPRASHVPLASWAGHSRAHVGGTSAEAVAAEHAAPATATAPHAATSAPLRCLPSWRNWRTRRARSYRPRSGCSPRLTTRSSRRSRRVASGCSALRG